MKAQSYGSNLFLNRINLIQYLKKSSYENENFFDHC